MGKTFGGEAVWRFVGCIAAMLLLLLFGALAAERGLEALAIVLLILIGAMAVECGLSVAAMISLRSNGLFHVKRPRG